MWAPVAGIAIIPISHNDFRVNNQIFNKMKETKLPTFTVHLIAH